MDTVKHMLDVSDKTANEVSLAMGKHRNFIATSIYKDSTPRIDTLAQIASLTGYELILRGHGEEIIIDTHAKNQRR